MCEKCESDEGRHDDKAAEEAGALAAPRRLRIWQMREHVECSVVGTCLSERDLDVILQRLRVTRKPDMPSYELHGYFVQAVRIDSALSRAVQKLLDKRHEGILRLVGQAVDEHQLAALWDREYRAGRISGAYWAFQTYAHIPHELHKRIYGDVHMLSHVLGRAVRADLEQVADLQARVTYLEARAAKQMRQHQQVLEARDHRIRQLEAQLKSRMSSSDMHPSQTGEPVTAKARKHADLDKRARVLVATRERAKAAEARCENLQEQLDRLTRAVRRFEMLGTTSETLNGQECPGEVACRLDLPKDEPLRVLYLGGRSGSIEQLRLIAEQASAELLHHDGGLQENFHRIKPMIEQCHVVFCPIDCVSHRACLLAKSHCKRLQKEFVTLRSSGQASFQRALRELVG